MDKIIGWGLVVIVILTIWTVVTPNHLFIG
jgi:hypothetical protein